MEIKFPVVTVNFDIYLYKIHPVAVKRIYYKTFNMSRTKYQNLNVSRIVL